jgi:acyl-homoserine-lactone acylase
LIIGGIISYIWSGVTGVVPGKGDSLWKEFVAYKDLPRVLNPSSGFIQNCNNAPWNTSTSDNPMPEDFSVTMGIENSITNRAHRALELLSGDPSITWAAFKQYKFDTIWSENSLFIRYLNELIAVLYQDIVTEQPWIVTEPVFLEGLEILKQWDRRANAENLYAAIPILTISPFLQSSLWSFDPSVYLKEDFSPVVTRFQVVVKQVFYYHSRLDIPWGEIHRFTRNINAPIGGASDVLHTSKSFLRLASFIL